MTLWLLALACSPPDDKTPVDTADADTDTDSDTDADTDSDTDTDTDTVCDPAVASIALPDFTMALGGSTLEVDPKTIDPESDNFPESLHKIWIPPGDGSTWRDELVVLLPGTGNRPDAFDGVAEVAVRAGYPVIGLAWDSEIHPGELCIDETADLETFLACRTAVFEEKAYGNGASDVADISEADSVVGRLSRLLTWLDAAYPDAGIDVWLDAGEPRWGSIVLTGFSQGASMAGYLSKDEELARVVLLAGGCDASTEDGIVYMADWCTAARATAPERTWALGHLRDDPTADAAVHEAYGLLALGDYADAGVESPAYCTNTHLLYFDLDAEGDNPDQGHLATAHDEFVPLNEDGTLALGEDYYYMFTAE